MTETAKKLEPTALEAYAVRQTEDRLFDNLVGCYFGWRADRTVKGDGARIALSAVITAMGWRERAIVELNRLEETYSIHAKTLEERD